MPAQLEDVMVDRYTKIVLTIIAAPDSHDYEITAHLGSGGMGMFTGYR